MLIRRDRFVRLLRAALLVAGCLTIISGRAADPAPYPNRAIKIVVAYTPGGTTDIIARLMAQRMSESLGQPVLVENKPGAGGNLGAELVANSPPDGYTLQMGTAGNMTINPSVYSNMKFDPVRDFAPISLIAAVPNIMVVHPALPVNTVQEFVAWAKKNAGKVNFGSSGTGNSPHMTGELFNIATGLTMVHVPYRGSAPALTDLLANQGIQVIFDNMPAAIGYVQSGQLRALAVTSPTRSNTAPQVPTLQEAGFPGFDVQGWFGLFAPAKTPDAVISRLHKAAMVALEQPETRRKLDELGAQIVGNTPQEFSRLVVEESKRWSDVVRKANIHVN